MEKPLLRPKENLDEIVIVTYSPKYKAYQKRIRKQQISRAVKMMEQPGKKDVVKLE